jgi:DNA polymerase III epsilon subunit-like protein
MIAFDLETTALDPQKGSIVAIGAVEYENPSNQFYIENRVWDGAIIEEGALAVNGFTRQQITDPARPSLEEAIAKLLAWVKTCKECTLLGSNIDAFDRPVLWAAFKRCGYPDGTNKYGQSTAYGEAIFGRHAESAPAIARSTRRRLAHKGIDLYRPFEHIYSLDKALEFVGIPHEPKPHIALMGAKMAAEVAHRCEKGKPLFTECTSYKIPDYLLRL